MFSVQQKIFIYLISLQATGRKNSKAVFRNTLMKKKNKRKNVCRYFYWLIIPVSVTKAYKHNCNWSFVQCYQDAVHQSLKNILASLFCCY